MRTLKRTQMFVRVISGSLTTGIIVFGMPSVGGAQSSCDRIESVVCRVDVFQQSGDDRPYAYENAGIGAYACRLATEHARYKITLRGRPVWVSSYQFQLNTCREIVPLFRQKQDQDVAGPQAAVPSKPDARVAVAAPPPSAVTSGRLEAARQRPQREADEIQLNRTAPQTGVLLAPPAAEYAAPPASIIRPPMVAMSPPQSESTDRPPATTASRPPPTSANRQPVITASRPPPASIARPVAAGAPPPPAAQLRPAGEIGRAVVQCR